MFSHIQSPWHRLISTILILHITTYSPLYTNARYASSSTSSSTPRLYKTLGLTKEATSDDIRKAYRKLALKHHPDKVSASQRSTAEDEFKKIAQAYETLSDEKKRELYDQYGERSLDQNFQPSPFGGGAGGASPFPFQPGGPGTSSWSTNGAWGTQSTFSFDDILSSIFEQQSSYGGYSRRGGSYTRNNRRRPAGFGTRGSPSDFTSLFESMLGGGGMRQARRGGFSSSHGFTPPSQRQRPRPQPQQQRRRFQDQTRPPPTPPVTRNFYCTLEELSNPQGCTKKLKVTHDVLLHHNQDNNHDDDAFVQERPQRKRISKIYTLHIQPGWKPGTKLLFPPTKTGMPPMTFVLQQSPHDYLERQGDDLVYECSISSQEAQKGSGRKKKEVILPNGEVIRFGVRPRTKNGMMRVFEGKGMPKKGGIDRGDLIVKFWVEG